KEAANLEDDHANFPWRKFPWQKAIIYFTRLMGSVHIGNIDSAKAELQELNIIYDTLTKQKDAYKAGQVQIQIRTSEAWIQLKEGNNNEALRLMNIAADMEDRTEKHPVTPGEVIPARELLGDILLQMNQADKALKAYEAVLKKSPNRFNGMYGAGLSAERSGKAAMAKLYYTQLVNISNANSNRPELKKIKVYLMGH
ncbi:MAG: tetratricopeptide repeat protein, partial [Ginsengibacter sp.]